MADKTERLIIRAPTEFMDRLDEVRGGLSRSEYVRTAVEEKMGKPKRRKRGEGTPLPKIAKAHWKPS